MAFNYSPKIVTDGLVLYLDAANSKSYTSGSTTWRDLTRNGNNGTLTNGPTFSSANGGSIVFDGTNDYVPITQTTSLVLTQGTFIAWIKKNGEQPTTFTGIIHSRGGTGGNVTGINFNVGKTQLGYHWNDAPNTYNWASGLIIPETWSFVAVSISPTFATAYLGISTGITTAINNVTHTTTTLAQLSIARDNAGRYFKGDIAQSFLYNRALSATEIQQNFNATRGRFGI